MIIVVGNFNFIIDYKVFEYIFIQRKMNNKEMFSFSSSHTKSIALVKLSTEALQCIEEYARIGASAGFKPSIQIKDGQGVLSIPGMNSVESFSFSLSDVEGNGSQGSLQCVEKSQDGEMTSLGNVETKIQIHAKTESIAHTKSKIEADDEKQKKYGAKVINSSSSSQATSSQAIEQTGQAESSAPRERKKAVPLLKKLLSRNFLKGLRSGNAAVSRLVPNSAPPRAAVLLTEPPPITNSKEQKILEMKKKRMLEDNAGEAYSDPRRKKQRIAHCSQSDPLPVNKVNPIVATIKSEMVKSAHANKTQSQETKKRKHISLDTKKDPSPINKANESQTPIALNIVKSERVVSAHANTTQCRETKRGILLNNQIKSEPGIKIEYSVAPTVQTQSINKSKAAVLKPGDKMSFLEAKDLRKTLKNRRRRRRQKQKKREQKRAALMESSGSRIPPVRESQSHKNTPREPPAAVVKTEDPTNNMNLISPKSTFSDIHVAVAEFQKPKITCSETPVAVVKTQEPKNNPNLISPKTTLSAPTALLKAAKTQKHTLKLSETPVVVVKTEESNNNLTPMTPKNTLCETSAAVTVSESPVAVVETRELKQLCKRIEQPLAKIDKQNLVEAKKQHEFTLDATKPCKKKLKMSQSNQNDLPFVNQEEVSSISNLDSTSTKANGSNLQDSNFTQKETKSERVEEEGKLPKASTKSLDCLEPSVLDILPAKSTKCEVQLPDLVQHCERVVIKDPSDNEDSIIQSLANEQMDMHTEVSETRTNPPLSPTGIPGTSLCSSKDSVLCSNKCKIRNPSFSQSCCSYGCEVTSTTKRMRTPLPQETPIATTSTEGIAISTLTPTEAEISGGTGEFEEITTLEQRELYKTVFSKKFEEYEKLQEDLSIYDKYLQSLARTMKVYSKGSDDYNKVKAKFYESFSYHKRRTEEYAVLRTQLEHIKELVMRFDSKL